MANEIALGNSGWGADISIGPTGDFVVIQDTPGNPAASLQRLTRIILTNPIGFDAYGNGISRPDDIFNPWLGSGARAAIGQPLTPALAAWLQNNILAAIAADSNFATSPAPVVTPYTDGTGSGQILLYVQAYTIQGEVAVLPAQALAFF